MAGSREWINSVFCLQHTSFQVQTPTGAAASDGMSPESTGSCPVSLMGGRCTSKEEEEHPQSDGRGGGGVIREDRRVSHYLPGPAL